MCLAILNRGMEALVDHDSSGRALFVRAGVCYATFMRKNGSNIVDAAPSRGFNPDKDYVAAFNSRYGRDGEFKKIMNGPGDKDSKLHTWARQVAEREMDEITQAFGAHGPQLKRMVQEHLFGDAG